MPTIKDVAAKAGVSVTTVSRVMNKRGYISQETYDKVYSAMDELDYIPNQLARNLYNKRTYYIGLLIPDITHPFFAELASEVCLLLYQRDYKLMLCDSKNKLNQEHDYLVMLRQNKVDGIIIGTHMLETSEYEKLDLPIVGTDMFLGRHIPVVYSDHRKGGRLAAQKLIDNGCKLVLQIRGNSKVNSPSHTRHDVFRDTCAEHSVRCLEYELTSDEFETDKYYEIIARIMEKNPGIDGFFSTDIIAANAIRWAADHQVPIPGKLRIVGYDGVELSRLVTPSITTVRQPMHKIAQAVVDTLIRKIEGEETQEIHIVIPDVELWEGGTTL